MIRAHPFTGLAIGHGIGLSEIPRTLTLPWMAQGNHVRPTRQRGER
jgi:hypothetical protein